MTEDFYVTEAMTEFGGEFVKRLGMLYRVADSENQDRIKASWPEYWEKYRGIAEMKEKQCPNCGSFDVVKTHFDNMKVQFGGHASDSVAGASCDECQKCGHHFGYDTCTT